MPRICHSGFIVSALLLLIGCAPLPLPGIGWTVVPLTGSAGGTLELPGYSLGPVSSEELPDLIVRAIPPGEGTAHLSGRVELSLQLDSHFYLLAAVASLTDTDILLLQWHDPEGHYEILGRLPYSDVLSLSKNAVGFGRTLYLCVATTEFAWGEQTYAMDQRASMSFIRPAGSFHDADRTEAALELLREKTTPTEGACDAPAEATDAAEDAAPQLNSR
jgi:hypothetical protein